MFLECLWGIETRFCVWQATIHACVFRVPMRNWNQTYATALLAIAIVFRVPMRNWNSYGSLHSMCPIFKFLECLWGIETEKLTKHNYSLSWVFRVPMRNWNSNKMEERAIGDEVFRVPMRNWNYKLKEDVLTFMLVFRVPMRNWNYNTWHLCRNKQRVFRVPMRNWNKTFLW